MISVIECKDSCGKNKVGPKWAPLSKVGKRWGKGGPNVESVAVALKLAVESGEKVGQPTFSPLNVSVALKLAVESGEKVGWPTFSPLNVSVALKLANFSATESSSNM